MLGQEVEGLVIQGYVGVVIFMLCFVFLERKLQLFLYLSNVTVFGFEKALKKRPVKFQREINQEC